MASLMPSNTLGIDALGVVGGLDQIGPERADQHRLAHPVRAVLPDISRDFAGPHREPDERHVSQVQGLQDHVEIGSERVVVVSGRRVCSTGRSRDGRT